MKETSKLTEYRWAKGYQNFLVGNGIDIGGGDDPLMPGMFPGILSVRNYDRGEGFCQANAQTCANIGDEEFDFVYSSHCLEHMEYPINALVNWVRICKVGGHIVVAVPHEVYYEKCRWPSMFNSEHKFSFRNGGDTKMPKSFEIKAMVATIPNVELVRCELVLEKFDFDRFWEDQTRGPASCQIDFILRKV